MRGGKREGAGRKPSEPTVRVSLPAGLVELLPPLIDLYKSGQTENVKGIITVASMIVSQTINGSDTLHIQPTSTVDLNHSQTIRELDSRSKQNSSSADLNDSHTIKSHLNAIHSSVDLDRDKHEDTLSVMDNQAIKKAAKELEKLNNKTCKVLRRSFGSLYKAAELGVRADGKGIYIPEAVEHLLSVPTHQLLFI